MHLTFIHLGEKVKRDKDGNLYTDGSYSMRIWERYLQLFDRITLVMREDKELFPVEEATKKFNRISSDRIDFIAVSDINGSFKSYLNLSVRNQRKEIIKSAIDDGDCVIVRLPGVDWVIDYAKRNNKPCLVEVVGCPFDTLWNHSWKGKFLAIPNCIRLKKAMRKATHAIYVTSSFLQNRYPTRGKQIGCSDVQISVALKESDVYPAKEHTDDVIYLGTAAAVNIKYKGQQYVINALKYLKEHSSQKFVYQIAGNGDASFLKSLVNKYGLQDTVEFMGSIPHDKMSDWYRSLDIYIQPSKQEGLPRALVEAMSNGLPCIGSNAGGIPELLDEVSIFPKGDAKRLAMILVKFADSEYRKKKALLCYEKSKEFDESKLEKKRIAFMKEALVGGTSDDK